VDDDSDDYRDTDHYDDNDYVDNDPYDYDADDQHDDDVGGDEHVEFGAHHDSDVAAVDRGGDTED
jgi:hypothetical protein